MLWMKEAACRGTDTSLFFPADVERLPERKIREAKAKAICYRCTVVNECLNAGEGEDGIWGGLNENERSGKLHKRPLERPVVKEFENDAQPWVMIDANGNAQIWQRESAESWHGVEWAVVLRNEIIYTSFNLDATYAKYGCVLFS